MPRHLVPILVAAALAVLLSVSAAILELSATTKWSIAIGLGVVLALIGTPYAMREQRPPRGSRERRLHPGDGSSRTP